MSCNFPLTVISIAVLQMICLLLTASACSDHAPTLPDNNNSSNHTHCACRHKDQEQLVKQFNAISNSRCAVLSRVNVPVDGHTWRSVYVVTVNTSCFRTAVYMSECFATSSLTTPHCSWSYQWIDLGEDVFPRFASSVQCRGSKVCVAQARFFRLTVLRRQDSCDGDGEVWAEEHLQQKINVSCDCTYIPY